MKHIMESLKNSKTKDWLPFVISCTLGLLIFLFLYFCTTPHIFLTYKNVSAYVMGFGIGLTLNNIFSKKEKN